MLSPLTHRMRHEGVDRRTPLALALAAALTACTMVVGVAAAEAQSGEVVPEGKVDICNYVGTPGVDAVLASGNPIEISVGAIRVNPDDPPFVVVHDPVQVGDVFTNGQGFSVVVAVAGQPQATIEDCPVFEPPPPTEKDEAKDDCEALKEAEQEGTEEDKEEAEEAKEDCDARVESQFD